VRILPYPTRQEIQLNDSYEISSHQLAETNKWNNIKKKGSENKPNEKQAQPKHEINNRKTFVKSR
jgi:hypothetical protein